MSTETKPDLAAPRYAPVKYSAYTVLVVLLVTMLVISNICATKGVTLFPDLNLSIGFIDLSQGLPTDGAFYLFPLTYIIGDVISEIYGFRAMRRAVLMSFVVTLLAALAFTTTIALPPATWYENQAAFASTVGVLPQILLASVVAFVLGEIVNSYILVRMKRRTGEKGLVGRLLSSTVLGQFVDTLAFGLIAAPAIGLAAATTDIGFLKIAQLDAESTKTIAAFIIIGFVWKTLVEMCVLPLTVAVIKYIKKIEPEYASSVR